MERSRVFFDGGGWTVPYTIGVAYTLQKMKYRDVNYAGVSAGACVALALALDVPMMKLMYEVLRWSKVCRMNPQNTATAINEICQTLVEDSDLSLISGPENSNRLIIGATLARLDGYKLPLKRVVNNELSSIDEVMRTLNMTCSLPFINTNVVEFCDRGIVIDGVLVNDRGAFAKFPDETLYRISCNHKYSDKTDNDVVCSRKLTLTDSIYPMEPDDLKSLFWLGAEEGKQLMHRLRQRKFITPVKKTPSSVQDAINRSKRIPSVTRRVTVF